MKNILVIIILFVIFFVFYWYATFLYQKKIEELSDAIYKNHDYNLFKKILNQSDTKLFISRKQRNILETSARLMFNDLDKIEELFNNLCDEKLIPSQRVTLYSNQIMYYIMKKDKEKAVEVYKDFEEEFKNINDLYVQGLLKETRYQVYVDLLEDTSYMDVLAKEINETRNDVLKGNYLLRLGKLLLKDNRKKEAIEYFENAEKSLENTIYKKELEAILEKLS